MRQILLFAALAASLALLSGCTLSKTKKDTEDMTDKAAYHKLSAEEAYEMMPKTLTNNKKQLRFCGNAFFLYFWEK